MKNVRGIIVGISQTDEPDPLDEAWSCSAFFPPATATGYKCLGFVWQKGVMRRLDTLGGTHSFATGANNRGQVVGWAENEVLDDSCVLPQQLQFRAVVWGPRPDQIRELPPLPATDDTVPGTEDSTSAATAINDRGQVVGISGKCDDAVGKFSAIHAVMWERGVPRDLGQHRRKSVEHADGDQRSGRCGGVRQRVRYTERRVQRARLSLDEARRDPGSRHAGG